MDIVRFDGREANELRPISFVNNIAPHAMGSTLIRWGNTQVICAVTIEENIPRWMKEQSVEGGWLTAEYSMLPYSTLTRKARDISKGKLDGRSQEIQRLIGRSLRSVVDLKKIGNRTFYIDCDVLQADGGTRTASITGSYVALKLAVKKLMSEGKLESDPIKKAVAAVSVGVFDGNPILDLNYEEDSHAEVDMNIVMTSEGEFCELQGTGERSTITPAHLQTLLNLGHQGVEKLLQKQSEILTNSQ